MGVGAMRRAAAGILILAGGMAAAQATAWPQAAGPARAAGSTQSSKAPEPGRAAKAPEAARAAKPSKPELQIAITFDDLPVHGPLPPGETRVQVAQEVIRALRAAHVPPTYGFVNAQRIEDNPETVNVLGVWRGAGDLLGNHTWSHMNLDQHTLQDFEQDTLKNEPILELLMAGQDWRWLRYPYLVEGSTQAKKMGIRAFLAEHGYRIAGVTMSFNDYDWNQPYARCMKKHDAAAISWLEASYLGAAEEAIGQEHAMSTQLYGKDIPYVLLMHIGAFDARMLPRLLALYRRHGFQFVSLEQAERDPFYKYDVDPKLLPGPDMLQQAMEQKHLTPPKLEIPEKKLTTICQ